MEASLSNERLKKIGAGLLTSPASVLFTLILLEIGVRLFAPVTDYPLLKYESGVGLHYAPNQSGKRTFGPDGSVGGQYRMNTRDGIRSTITQPTNPPASCG